MSETWFYSDPHFFHEKIIEYCNRPFDNVKQMNEAILENLNAVIKPKDFVYCLGDVFYWRIAFARMEAMFRLMPGRKFLIIGNHDKMHQMKKLPWEWICQQKEIRVKRQRIFLNHYAMRTWNHAFKGSWHLFGHSHGLLEPHGLSCPIDVDSWEFSPVHFDTITKLMRKLESHTDQDDRDNKIWLGQEFSK